MECLPVKLHGKDFAIDDFADQQKLMSGRPVRIIVDAGANIGNTIAVYTSLFPESEVYAFEPYPPTYSEWTKSAHPVR